MLPYILLLSITALFPLCYYRIDGIVTADHYAYVIQKRNKMAVSVFFIGLFILLSLRDISVGKDLTEYNAIFEICYRTPFKNLLDLNWELGYTAYNKLIAFVSKDYRFFLIITAFIVLLPIYKLYSKENTFGFLLVILFINMPCFLMIFSGLRQAIAISVGILVYLAIEEKKYIRGVLLIFLAMSFHTSAAVLFFLYPAFFLKVRSKHLLFIVPILFGIYIFRIPILSLVLAVTPRKYIEFYGKVQQTGAFGMMVLFLIFFTFSFVILDEEKMSQKDYFMRNILTIAAVMQFFVPIHGLIQRASYYFLIFTPVSLVGVVKAPKKRLENISDVAVVVMTCFFLLYFFCTAIFSTDNLLDVFPYKFFWSGR